ncbi:MAG: hypothetical protein LBM08_11760 [Dysgonamonadaceae bacterium]|jgi:hypothetical protein|nr:hypothetical protein [Dysgonamonadaceae bacterium]
MMKILFEKKKKERAGTSGNFRWYSTRCGILLLCLFVMRAISAQITYVSPLNIGIGGNEDVAYTGVPGVPYIGNYGTGTITLDSDGLHVNAVGGNIIISLPVSGFSTASGEPTVTYIPLSYGSLSPYTPSGTHADVGMNLYGFNDPATATDWYSISNSTVGPNWKTGGSIGSTTGINWGNALQTHLPNVRVLSLTVGPGYSVIIQSISIDGQQFSFTPPPLSISDVSKNSLFSVPEIGREFQYFSLKVQGVSSESVIIDMNFPDNNRDSIYVEYYENQGGLGWTNLFSSQGDHLTTNGFPVVDGAELRLRIKSAVVGAADQHVNFNVALQDATTKNNDLTQRIYGGFTALAATNSLLIIDRNDLASVPEIGQEYQYFTLKLKGEYPDDIVLDLRDTVNLSSIIVEYYENQSNLGWTDLFDGTHLISTGFPVVNDSELRLRIKSAVTGTANESVGFSIALKDVLAGTVLSNRIYGGFDALAPVAPVYNLTIVDRNDLASVAEIGQEYQYFTLKVKGTYPNNIVLDHHITGQDSIIIEYYENQGTPAIGWKNLFDGTHLISTGFPVVDGSELRLRIKSVVTGAAKDSVSFDIALREVGGTDDLSNRIYGGFYVLPPVYPLKVKAFTITQPQNCNDKGEINFTIEGGAVEVSTGEYRYELFGVTSIIGVTDKQQIKIDTLSAGEYTLTVQDTTNLTVAPIIRTFIITAAGVEALKVTSFVINQPTKCTGQDAEGSISVAIGGGAATEYRYELLGNTSVIGDTQSKQIAIGGLLAGEYTLTIQDPTCLAVAPITRTFVITAAGIEPLKVKEFTITQPTECTGTYVKGSVSFYITGGAATDYRYELFGDTIMIGTLINQSQGNIPNLNPGEYTLTIQDITCPAIAPITRTFVITAAGIDALKVKDFTITQPATCDDRGDISFDIDGGAADNYRYELFGNTVVIGATDNDGSGNIQNLNPGEYTLRIQDTTCLAIAPITRTFVITAAGIDALKVTNSVITQPIGCTGANAKGAIFFDIAGGAAADYRYELLGDTSVIGATDKKQIDINGLPAGEYMLTVQDTTCLAIAPITRTFIITAAGIDALKFTSVTITQPENCDAFGEIDFTAAGGSAVQYRYELFGDTAVIGITNADGTERITNLNPGNYTLTIQDTTCLAVAPITRVFTIHRSPLSINVDDYINLNGKEYEYKNGDQVPTINLASNPLPEGFVFQWEDTSKSTIGIAPQGSAEIPGFRAVYSDLPGAVNTATVTYRIVRLDGTSCLQDNLTGSFTIKVTPKTVTDLDLVAKAVVSQVKCNQEAFNPITFSAYRTNGGSLDSVSYIVDFVGGIDVLAGKPEAFARITADKQGKWDIDSIAVDNRLSGEGFYRVTPRSEYGEGKPVIFSLTVIPAPQVDTIPNYVLCNNSPLSVSFTSPITNTLFDWSADANGQSLGIPAWGTTAIDLISLNNTTTGAVTATITVTPRLAACSGVASSVKTFTITVLPTPTVNALPNTIAENDSTIAAIPFSGTATTYRWVNDNPGISSDGKLTGGTGTALPQFIAENGGQGPVTAKITVTPIYGFEVSAADTFFCEGTPTEFYILVASKPAINAIPDLTLCEGALSSPIIPTGLPIGNGYSITWSGGASVGLADNSLIGLTRNIPSFVVLSTNASAKTTASINVVPWIRLNGQNFPGNTVTFTVTVVPAVVLTPGYEAIDANIQVLTPCAGEPVTIDVQATGVDLQYQWYRNYIAIAGATNAQYEIPAIELADAGIYYAVVTGACNSLQARTYYISVKVNVVSQLWSDVLLLNCNPKENGGFTFSNKQWYVIENGVTRKLIGENRSYLYIENGLDVNALYYVEAETQTGKVYVSCPFAPQALSAAANVSVYPNPIYKGEAVNITVPAAQLPNGVRVQILNSAGHILNTVPVTAAESKVIISNYPGIYTLVIWAGDVKLRAFPIIVK